MAHITFDETKLKELFKTALLELVQEEKEVFSEIFAEVLEDIGLENAMIKNLGCYYPIVGLLSII
ncbi:hypothetical protein PN462_13355 [Spirulina sp. CS-785/01]|uniref:hypothetical protein n=1 Tax=Spirulina sp. CS-785/01 TaxID=3021716 RepID=UPI00232EAD41|nr:hypothetical protein [Spirulina sp. CS-785/01]MDB9314092.1 hypothetical protein [Spirulina sp. CS-785/01]